MFKHQGHPNDTPPRLMNYMNHLTYLENEMSGDKKAKADLPKSDMLVDSVWHCGR